MELRTDRLVLRDFLPSDAEALAAYQADPRYLEHYDHSAAITDAHALVDLFGAWALESPRTKYQLAIVLDGRVIGTCGVRQDAGEAEFGCELDPGYWNAGYAREASRGDPGVRIHDAGPEAHRGPDADLEPACNCARVVPRFPGGCQGCLRLRS
jgi:hypothetical protein